MYTLSNTRITQNGTIFLVPCELLPYLDEIYVLIKTTSVVNAFIYVADRHGVVLIKPEPLKTVRTQPPAAPFKVRSNQPVDYFMLTDIATGYDSIVLTNYGTDTDNARYVTTFNLEQDTTTYENMYNKSGPMANLLKNTFPKAVICTSIDDSNIRDCVGYIIQSRVAKLLIFLPMIHIKLEYLYTPNQKTNAGVFFRKIGCSIDQNSQDVLYKYTGSTDLNTIS